MLSFGQSAPHVPPPSTCTDRNEDIPRKRLCPFLWPSDFGYQESHNGIKKRLKTARGNSSARKMSPSSDNLQDRLELRRMCQ